MSEKVQVSIIIVCMNNLRNLFPCLDSIIHETKLEYEIWVVAYLFDMMNMQLLKKKYPLVKIVVSNEIRGFSENNNLALHIAIGEYCFILNDDTIIENSAIDRLYESFQIIPDASVVSPKTIYGDGTLQSCGRPRLNSFTFILSKCGLWNEQTVKSKYTNGIKLFQTYNIVGAAFMIKRDIFKNLGFFDEKYFFCPEDIALSTLLNNKGYKLYVNPDICIIHLESSTASMVKTATLPSSIKGELIFYSNDKKLKKIILQCLIMGISLIKYILFLLLELLGGKDFYIKRKAYGNVLMEVFSNLSPKDVFVKYYKRIKE